MTNVHARPGSYGITNVDHLVCLTYEELREALDLREKCGSTPFLNLFKLFNLNPDAPRNHNALLEIVDGEPVAYAFKQRHWREVDCEEMVRDCVNNAAIRFLDIESILAPRVPAKGFSKLTNMRDTVERETNGLVKEPSTEVRGLMRRTSNANAARASVGAASTSAASAAGTGSTLMALLSCAISETDAFITGL